MASIASQMEALRAAKYGYEARTPISEALVIINGGSAHTGRLDYIGELPNGTNLNSLIDHSNLGIYWMIGSRTYYNDPSGSDGGIGDLSNDQKILTVYSWGPSYARQVVDVISTDGYSVNTYHYARCYVNGTWSNWYFC